MASSRVGAQASNVIPATATASIDIRLVKGMDPQRTGERVIEHIRKQGFFVVDTSRRRRRSAWRTRSVIGSIARAPARRGPHADGSADLAGGDPRRGEACAARRQAAEHGRQPAAGEHRAAARARARSSIPIGNHDNNQHSFDENLRIQNLWDGIELMAALLTM